MPKHEQVKLVDKELLDVAEGGSPNKLLIINEDELYSNLILIRNNSNNQLFEIEAVRNIDKAPVCTINDSLSLFVLLAIVAVTSVYLHLGELHTAFHGIVTAVPHFCFFPHHQETGYRGMVTDYTVPHKIWGTYAHTMAQWTAIDLA